MAKLAQGLLRYTHLFIYTYYTVLFLFHETRVKGSDSDILGPKKSIETFVGKRGQS